MANPKVKRAEIDPPPKATVVYIPESQILYIENGLLRDEAEEMAQDTHVYYGKDDATSAVAIRIDRAETILKPFVDAILAKYGVKPERHAQT